MLVYLDSSLIIKRYIEEEGTDLADYVFDKAAQGYLSLTYNLLNIGEVLGVFDRYFKRKLITKDEFEDIKRKFVDETLRLIRLQRLTILPTSNMQQMAGWGLVLSERLYIVDAIQITSFSEINATLFISGDNYLVTIARKLGIAAFSTEESSEVLSEIKKSLLSS